MARRTPIDTDHPGYDPSACGPNGLPQCRRCLIEIINGDSQFCGEDCRHDFQIRASLAYARRAVYCRDRGVCTHCRLDCGLLDRIIRRLCTTAEGHQLALVIIATLGFGHPRRITSLWQADHRIAVTEGGANCGLGNYRTLCLRCHTKETLELHRRVKRRKDVWQS